MTNLITCTALAQIHLFTEKGRHSPIASGYRPNHAFIYHGDIDGKPKYEAVMGIIHLLDRQILALGETAMVQIYFIVSPTMFTKIEQGFTWRIYEGATWVGTGEICEVLINDNPF